jgi:hypothetical protein
VIGHHRTYLEASSGRGEAKVDKVGTGEPDGEAEAEAEDGAHEAHRRPCDLECRCVRRRRKPHGKQRAALRVLEEACRLVVDATRCSSRRRRAGRPRRRR